ncbi:MAG: hypothetical protein FWF87_07880 [Synergistaceae bacterium]|nr:hypothetical protein [Synergistaceae bacterium]
MSPRSLFQRMCVVLALIAIATFLFYIGKGHTLFIDTNALTVGDNELRSYASATVIVNGKKLNSSMGRAERSMVVVGGPKHTIEIVDDADTDRRVTKKLTIPTFMNKVIVSIPAIIGDCPEEYWITPFIPPSMVDVPVEKMQQQNTLP